MQKRGLSYHKSLTFTGFFLVSRVGFSTSSEPDGLKSLSSSLSETILTLAGFFFSLFLPNDRVVCFLAVLPPAKS